MKKITAIVSMGIFFAVAGTSCKDSKKAPNDKQARAIVNKWYKEQYQFQ